MLELQANRPQFLLSYQCDAGKFRAGYDETGNGGIEREVKTGWKARHIDHVCKTLRNL